MRARAIRFRRNGRGIVVAAFRAAWRPPLVLPERLPKPKHASHLPPWSRPRAFHGAAP